MGLDEALLESPGAPPTLRLYTWKPDTLSLGYFQRFEDVPATARAGAVVRRITGGGAIHHAGELTFSITADAEHPLYRGPIAGSYERVHGALIEALAAVGITAALRADDDLDSDQNGTGMCFHASTPLDIVWGARKGIGSAQRRRAGRVLHHGSIKLDGSALETGVACAPGIEPPVMGEALVAALARHFELEFVPDSPRTDELEQAEQRGRRYTDPSFVRRR
jgi:lipoyl(octanoyl) transferase